MLTEQQLDHFNTFGFLLFRQVFSLTELATIEVEYEQGLTAAYRDKPFDGTTRHCTCTMGPATPLLATLLEDERFHRPAQQLYDDDVIGMVADANRYVGHTNWHPDHNADPTEDCYGIKLPIIWIRSAPRAVRCGACLAPTNCPSIMNHCN